MICSVSILTCGDKYWLFLVTVVVVCRDLVYIWFREKYLYDRTLKNPLTYLPIPFELVILILMVFDVSVKALIVILVAFLASAATTQFDIIVKYN